MIWKLIIYQIIMVGPMGWRQVRRKHLILLLSDYFIRLTTNLNRYGWDHLNNGNFGGLKCINITVQEMHNLYGVVLQIYILILGISQSKLLQNKPFKIILMWIRKNKPKNRIITKNTYNLCSEVRSMLEISPF